MTRPTLLTTVALAASLCAASAPTWSQSSGDNYNPSWYVVPSINLVDPDSRFGVNDNGEGVGLRFGKPVSASWDVQLGGSFSRSRQAGSTLRRNALGIDGLYLFSRERLRPYVLVGVGVEYDKLSTPTNRTQRTSSFINAGLGVQYSLSEQWALQADFRRAQTYLRGDTFGFDRARTNVASLGVIYTFDKPASYAPVVREAPRPAPVAQAPAAPLVSPAPQPMAATPVPAPAPLPAPRTERYTLSDVELFAFDSAQLRTPQPKLDEIASALSQNAQVGNVVITGYTDRLGSEAYNLKLSQQRADAVKQYLANKGVGAARLSAVGRGEASPKVTCNDRVRKDLIECLAPNRRVEVEQITIERRVP